MSTQKIVKGPEDKRMDILAGSNLDPISTTRAIHKIIHQILLAFFNEKQVYPKRAVFGDNGQLMGSPRFCSINKDVRMYIASVVVRLVRFIHDNSAKIVKKNANDDVPHYAVAHRASQIKAGTTMLKVNTDKGERQVAKTDGTRASGLPLVKAALHIGADLKYREPGLDAKHQAIILAIVDGILQSAANSAAVVTVVKNVTTAARGKTDGYNNKWFVTSPSLNVIVFKAALALAISNQPDIKPHLDLRTVNAILDDNVDPLVMENFAIRSENSRRMSKIDTDDMRDKAKAKMAAYNAARANSPVAETLGLIAAYDDYTPLTDPARFRGTDIFVDEKGDFIGDAGPIEFPDVYKNRREAYLQARKNAKEGIRNARIGIKDYRQRIRSGAASGSKGGLAPMQTDVKDGAVNVPSNRMY